MVIPQHSPLIPTLLQTFHGSKLGGHSGAMEFYWEGMRRNVESYVAACVVCQKKKSPPRCRREDYCSPFLFPIEFGRIYPWISLKACLNKYDSILVFVDRLNKYAHFIGLKHPFSAKTVVVSFVKEIVHLHGFLRSIISDRDKVFLSHFWGELFRL